MGRRAPRAGLDRVETRTLQSMSGRSPQVARNLPVRHAIVRSTRRHLGGPRRLPPNLQPRHHQARAALIIPLDIFLDRWLRQHGAAGGLADAMVPVLNHRPEICVLPAIETPPSSAPAFGTRPIGCRASGRRQKPSKPGTRTGSTRPDSNLNGARGACSQATSTRRGARHPEVPGGRPRVIDAVRGGSDQSATKFMDLPAEVRSREVFGPPDRTSRTSPSQHHGIAHGAEKSIEPIQQGEPSWGTAEVPRSGACR